MLIVTCMIMLAYYWCSYFFKYDAPIIFITINGYSTILGYFFCVSSLLAAGLLYSSFQCIITHQFPPSAGFYLSEGQRVLLIPLVSFCASAILLFNAMSLSIIKFIMRAGYHSMYVPHRFSLSDGVVGAVCPRPSETLASLNLKRGLLGLMQNTMPRLDLSHSAREVRAPTITKSRRTIIIIINWSPQCKARIEWEQSVRRPQPHTSNPWKEEKDKIIGDKKEIADHANMKVFSLLLKPASPTPSITGSLRLSQRDTERGTKVGWYWEALQRGGANECLWATKAPRVTRAGTYRNDHGGN